MIWLTEKLKILSGHLGELSPGCRRAVRLQSEEFDRRLAFREQLGLRVHLLLCKWCRRYGKHLTFLRATARDGEPDCDSHREGLSAEARGRIKQRLSGGKE